MADTDSVQRDMPAPQVTVEEDLSGRTLGDYRLLRRLGRGAMAHVYLAEQTSLGRQVALKVLKAQLATDETYVKRFHHEARSAASLVHANIVQIYEVGRVDGVHFIAQEYVQGQNLAQLVSRNGPTDVPLAVTIIRQTASALHKAAERGIVHRDIKPENIMITAEGLVKVADFGLARASDAGGAPNLTQDGITMGTPLYMSPEQVEGRPLDHRADIYSLGVTCYHMLTGSPPFDGDTALNVAVQHLKTQPARLENVRGDLPGGLCRIVHKMLAKDPAERHQSARELIGDLRALPVEGLEDDWAEDLDGWASQETATLSAARTAATQQLETLLKRSAAQDHSRRRWSLIFLAISAALVAGGTLAWSQREESLLAGAAPPVVERKQTAEGQLKYALILGTEEAFSSVEEYFPDAAPEVFRAKQELASLFLRQDDFDRAMALFSELAELDPVDSGKLDPVEHTKLRAFGLAGQSVVFFLRDNLVATRNCLAKLAEMAGGELDPSRLEINLRLDPWTIARVDEVRKRSEFARSAASDQQWDEWLKDKFSDETELP